MVRARWPGLGLSALLLTSWAQASDMDDLLGALKRARTLAARGQAEVTVLFPPRAVPTRVTNGLPAVAFRPALIEKNFDAVRAGPDTLAGRAVTRFELIPKVGQAARWTLWIDVVWNVPLAFEERDVAGRLARRAALTQVGAAPKKVEQAPSGTPAGLGKALQSALPGLRLPPGFAPIAARLREGGQPEVSLSDGVNVLALIVSARGVKAAPGVASRQVGALHVWLVGNLPQPELERALGGVRAVDRSALGTFLAPAPSNP